MLNILNFVKITKLTTVNFLYSWYSLQYFESKLALLVSIILSGHLLPYLLSMGLTNHERRYISYSLSNFSPYGITVRKYLFQTAVYFICHCDASKLMNYICTCFSAVASTEVVISNRVNIYNESMLFFITVFVLVMKL